MCLVFHHDLNIKETLPPLLAPDRCIFDLVQHVSETSLIMLYHYNPHGVINMLPLKHNCDCGDIFFRQVPDADSLEKTADMLEHSLSLKGVYSVEGATRTINVVRFSLLRSPAMGSFSGLGVV